MTERRPLEPHDFGASLIRLIRRGRSFGAHPLWRRILAGSLSITELRTFAAQFFLQVVEFPRAVSALHSRCDDRAERLKLAESLYEEETGRLSDTKAHPELFLDFCEALGLERHSVSETEPLPSTAALVQWFEYSTKILPFLEGVAAINLAAEGQVVGAFAPLARAFEHHHGLDHKAVMFWDVHEIADAEHSDVGDHIVVRHARSLQVQTGIRKAIRTSLAMWWQFFDGIERACAANRGRASQRARSTSSVSGRGLRASPVRSRRR